MSAVPVKYRDNGHILFLRNPGSTITSLDEFRTVLADADDKDLSPNMSMYFDQEVSSILDHIKTLDTAARMIPHKTSFNSAVGTVCVLGVAVSAIATAIRLAEWTLLRAIVECEGAINNLSEDNNTELHYIDECIFNIIKEVK